MQENSPQSGPRSRATITYGPTGILENPDRVDQVRSRRGGSYYQVYGCGRHAATFHATSLEPAVVGDVKYWEFRISELVWTRPVALMLLQGHSVVSVLGCSIGLIRFTKKPPWDPRPGFTDVTAVSPYENPRGLLPLDLVRLVVSQAI